MHEIKPADEVSYLGILSKACPIMLANAAVPTLGLVDTAVMGHFGSLSELAGLAVAALLFSFVYWCFGFLRMSTTAYVAKADGADDTYALMRVMLQSLLLAIVFAFMLIIVQWPIYQAGLHLLAPPESVAPALKAYFDIRIWGAPAALLLYVLNGYLIGRGLGRQLLILQFLLNGLNALLDIVFAGYLGWGISGIALGTCIAEYATLCVALTLVARYHSWSSYLQSLRVIDLKKGAAALINQNSDIFVRTFFLLLSFVFFTRTGANFGEATLAANHILLQLISFSAFFLDGFAHVLESLVGRAFGRRSLRSLNAGLKKSSVLALCVAVVLSLSVLVGGNQIISVLTNKADVVVIAQTLLPLTALYIALSVAAFQLDGLFIGAAYGSAMRNCSILSTVLFVVLWYTLFHQYGNFGLWYAFIAFVCLRSLSLLMYLPSLRARCVTNV